MSKNNNSVEIEIASRHQPALSQGEYTINAKVDLSEDHNFDKIVNSEKVSQNFRIGGDGLTLDPNRIYSTYPVSESSGNFASYLPQLVINDRAFPWERKLAVKDGQKYPWVALLVFSEDEEVELSEAIAFNSIKAKEDQFFAKPKVIDEKTSVKTLDVSAALFQQVFPKLEELPYLVHARKTPLDNKSTEEGVKDEWFACITANRFPKAQEKESIDPVKHLACLISLEGFEAVFKDPKLLADKNSVKMICLHHWNFYCENHSDDLVEIVEKMSIQSIYQDFGKKAKVPEIASILEAGYQPINHKFREGSVSISWYRSPFIPYLTKKNQKPSVEQADSLLRFDQGLGTFDVSYSAAWQLGRMLALQNISFAQNLYLWRKENKGEAAKVQNNQLLMTQIGKKNLMNNPNTNVTDVCIDEWKKLLKDGTGQLEQADPTDLAGTSAPDFVNDKELMDDYLKPENRPLSQERLLSLLRKDGE